MGLFGRSTTNCASCGASLPAFVTGGDDRIDDLFKRSEINSLEHQRLCAQCLNDMHHSAAALESELSPSDAPVREYASVEGIWSPSDAEAPSLPEQSTYSGGQTAPEILKKASENKGCSLQWFLFAAFLIYLFSKLFSA